MDFTHLANHLSASVSNVMTHGPAAAPLWAAVLWLIILLYRKRICKCLCLLWGLGDPYLIQDVVKRVDGPVQVLLITLAGLPFIGLIHGKIVVELVRIGSLVAALLAVHIFVQSADLVLSRLYLNKRHTPLPAVLRSSVLGVIYVVTAFILLDWSLGVNVLPLLATSSLIAAVLGLALQDTLKNVFAGLTISMEKSIKQGDWVNFRLDQQNSRIGQVMEVGWRSTKIHTFNNNVSIIPNTLLIQNELVNYNSPTNHNGTVIEFPISIKVSPASVLKALSEASIATEGVLSEPAPEAAASVVNLDHIVYQLRFWTDGIERQAAISSKVIEGCWTKISKLRGMS